MKDITIICYPKCSTCAKAEKWLKNNGIEYDYRHIKDNNPSVEELSIWIAKSGLPASRFFNTSGKLYREQNIKEKLQTFRTEELIKILASDGMMVKRPVLLYGDTVLVGFKENEWEETLK